MGTMGLPTFCNQYVGKRVRVQTKNGAVHEGILHSMTQEGLILRPLNGSRLSSVSSAQSANKVPQHAIANNMDVDATQAWWPVWFLVSYAIIASFWGWGAGGWNGYGGTGGYAAPYGGYSGYGGYGGLGRRLWW